MKNKIIEALLYVQGDEGLTLEQVKELFGLNTIGEAKKIMNDFYKAYNESDGALKVVVFNEVYKLATRETYKDYVSKLVNVVRKTRLSNAAIEVAGIVAYKQPVTRSQVSYIRGVASDQVMASLIEKGVIEQVGVSPTPGNPILYGITNKFYDYFRIKTLAELPKLSEFSFVDSTDHGQDEFDLFGSQRDE
ncbi:SMC-Scp complex subunit ScpB [Mycoplasma crocodyli]|uniref:Segregation and condensation protein B n=1 Tax=Mycoplasma crocodyli (strain ATCC 51981 / MP145) TaxID=512564 RepID=D5E5U5_MYCCM|nr:SMC-Scp complex subunit ScpB [Mycoplasma crocodyli]ADE19607.1 chromosomal segregation and condensation complex, ScpB protein [Mycoplasma crocodyli MP145]